MHFAILQVMLFIFFNWYFQYHVLYSNKQCSVSNIINSLYQGVSYITKNMDVENLKIPQRTIWLPTGKLVKPYYTERYLQRGLTHRIHRNAHSSDLFTEIQEVEKPWIFNKNTWLYEEVPNDFHTWFNT